MRTLGLLLFLLGACTSPGKGDSNSADADTDTDSDTDTDTDSDTDADGLCPAFYGTVAATSVREYQIREEYADLYGYTGTWSSTITSIAGSVVVMEIDGSYVGTGYTTESRQSMTFTCDDAGVTVSSVHYAYTSTYDGGTADEGWTDSTYEPTMAFPAAGAAGSTWSTHYVIHSVDDAGHSNSYDYTTENTLVPSDDVTVPGGTFATVEWQQISSITPDTTYSQWLAAGPGYVLSDFGELVSYTP
jgi:hypothetical protein